MFEQFTMGVIEGFYGPAWSFAARAGYARFLRENGFAFYIYAPKGDLSLRKRWRDAWSADDRAALEALRDRYREVGVAFGVGLTPFGTQSQYGAEERRALERKIRDLDALDLDIFALLFDDVPGVPADLAERQVAITHDALAVSEACGFLMCPTYYADDPILDKVSGPRPARYLETLGAKLEPRVRVFWTGPRICSPEYSEAHLAAVARRIGRKPFLWDNYPVNDGPRMAKHLHLRAVTGRPHGLATWSAGLAANPMNQAELSKLPLATLQQSLQAGDAYEPQRAFESAARALWGPALAAALAEDLALFQDAGLDAIDADARERLVAKYRELASPAAAEVVAWLQGAFLPTEQLLAEFAGTGL
ncbi:MAG: protein O-GlcNAcase [Myxococcales bacterium]|nr:protein O-GlcNAcase [Myxococcales bacterium]